MRWMKYSLSVAGVFLVVGCSSSSAISAEALTQDQSTEVESSPPGDAALEFFEEQARLLTEAFDEICVQSNVEPEKIAERAEAAGWYRSNEWALEGTNKADWSSFPLQQMQEKGRLPFILELVDGRQESLGFVQCSTTMWGTSAEPTVGKKEMTLFRTILTEDYALGEVNETLPDTMDKERPTFHQYSFLFSEPGSDRQEWGYLWAGGTHRLIAKRTMD